MLTRRGLIGTLLAAPAIIRTPGLLMPVKPVVLAPTVAYKTTQYQRILGEYKRLHNYTPHRQWFTVTWRVLLDPDGKPIRCSLT